LRFFAVEIAAAVPWSEAKQVPLGYARPDNAVKSRWPLRRHSRRDRH